MDRMIYERTTSLNGSVIGSDDYLAVTKKVSLRHRILLSPVVKYGATTFFAIACLMTMVYLSMYFALSNLNNTWLSTCNIRTSYRVDCFPGRSNLTYDECSNVECCWDERNEFCYHSIPSHHGYTGKNGAQDYRENDVLVPRRASNSFGTKNVESLSLHLTNHLDPNHVEFVLKIIDATQAQSTEKQRILANDLSSTKKLKNANMQENGAGDLLHFLPQNSERRTSNIQTDPNSNLNVNVHMPEFSVTVTRKNESSKALLTTARGPLILTERYWEMTLHITNSTVYGLGQLELNGTTNWVYDNENGTSRIAFLGISDYGEGTACYVRHYGPMEIKVNNESNLIILRGFSLPDEISVHVFAGPTPLEAIRQLTKALRDNNRTTDSFELSNLGLHVCPNEDSADVIKSLDRFIEAMKETPWDSHCLHQDFDPTMGNEPMSPNNKLIVADALQRFNNDKEKRSLVPHLAPMVFGVNNMLAINLSESSLLLRADSNPYGGLYRNKQAFYPDWHDEKTREASLDSLNVYLKNFGNANFVFLRDSWPKDETEGLPVPNTFDYMPPMIQTLVGKSTVPYKLVSSARGKLHYTEHALYSSDFSKFVRQRGDLTSLVVRGLFGESGNSSWAALGVAITAGVGSGVVGQLPSPMYACGTGKELPSGTNSDELCSRWFGASIAWPHVLAIPSNLPGGDHLAETAKSYVRRHLIRRLSFITYVRTVIAQFYDDGSPILAPTSVYYPQDLRARYTPNQFMWGYGILVGLVTLPKVKQVSMYIPGNYTWRHLNHGIEVNPLPTGFVPINAFEDEIVTLIKPGSIIPIHEDLAMTSSTTIRGGLTLYVHRACDQLVCNAHGKIFYGSHVNDGAFLLLSATNKTLKLSNITNVQSKVCNANNPVDQTTTIRKIIVYNNPDIEPMKNICDIKSDSYEIPLL